MPQMKVVRLRGSPSALSRKERDKLPITGFTIDGDAAGFSVTLKTGPNEGDIDSIDQVETKDGHWVICPVWSSRQETILADARVALVELITPALTILLREAFEEADASTR